jgi:hypothetical protein
MDINAFDQAISRGLSKGEWKGLERWITQNSTFSYNYGAGRQSPFPNELFTRVVHLLTDARFLSAKRSSTLFRIIEYDWSTTTSEQRELLLGKLEEAFPRLADPLSRFLISEILGQYYANQGSLEALQRLTRTADADALCFLVVGLEYLARKRDSPQLARDACSELKRLASDPSGEVRAEAEGALQRLSSSSDTTRDSGQKKE